MKPSFYIKLFGAFIALIIILLLIISLAFNNFYSFYNNKKELANIENTLDTQAKKFSSFIKVYDEKLSFIEAIISKMKSKDEITKFLKETLFEDENILSFKIVASDSKEILKVLNKDNDLDTMEESVRLRSLFSEEYFKDLQALDNLDKYHYCGLEFSNYLNFAIRSNNEFYILKVDLSKLINEISNSYKERVLIKDTHNSFVNGLLSSDFKSEEYISRKAYLQKDKYFTLYINKNFDKNDKFIKEYYELIIIVAFILALVLSLIFTAIITKENSKIEQENKKLNFDIKETDLTLSENQKIMDDHIMFIQIDKHGIINKVSKAFCYFLGFSRSELIGHSYKLFIFKDMKRFFKKAVKKELNKETFQFTNIKGKRKNSESFWVDIFVEEIFKDGEINAYNIICEDVTDKKRIYLLYKDLNIKIEEYDAIFENVHSGIALLTLDAKFVKVNNKMSELLGFSEDELLNMTPLDIISSSSKDILKDILDEIEDFNKISKMEKIFLRKDGTPLHLELSLILISKKERIIFIINSLEDKRELQELNANLESRIQKELEKSKAKDKIHHKEQLKSAKMSYIGVLSAGITHEINTPLTYIKGNLELMQYDIEDLPSSDIRNRMITDSKKIKEGINRIANIVESMREISHANEETKGNFNIYATLLTALTMAHNRAKHISKIYINNELFNIDDMKNDRLEFISYIQKQRVEQIWIIIINNALDELIKIDDYEKRALKIDIFEEGSFIVVKFKDNAKGLDKLIMKKLFEPFTSSKNHGGMGIGLSIAKKIVEEHKGSIKAYNEDGAVFEVRLKKYKEESI